MTFGYLAEKWYNRALCGTTYSYQREINCAVNHLVDNLGKKEIKKITWIDIEDVMIQLAMYNPKTKRPGSKKLITDIRNCAYNILDFAIDLGEIQNNPVRRNKKIPRTMNSNGRRALTMKERETVLKTQHRLRLPALIMLFAGLRPNEVLALEYGDFDEELMRLNITKSVSLINNNTYVVKNGTKNGKSRYVNIPEILANEIREGKSKTKSNLITSQIDGSLHTLTSWRKAWKSYQTTLNYNAYGGPEHYFNPHGIPKVIDTITPYMFRHTFATMLYTSGVDPLTASKLMGHANVNTTLNFYTHLEETTKQLNISKFEKYVEENFSKLIAV